MKKRAKKVFVVVLVSLLACYLFGQDQNLDSLETALLEHSTKDTTRLNLLLNAATNLVNSSPERAFKYTEEAHTIADQLQWTEGMARVYRQEGDTYYRMGIYIKALEAYQESLSSGGFDHDKLQTAKIHNNLANIYADLKQFDDALLNYQRYLDIASVAENVPNQINALANLGTVYSETGEIEKSIAYHSRALELARAQNMNFAITAIINNLGLTYKRKGDYATSMTHYEQARELSVIHEFKHIEASALNSIGKVHVLQQNYPLAKTFAEQALALSVEVESLEWQADSWQILSTVNEKLGAPQEALIAYKNYVQLRDSISNAEKVVEFTQKDLQYRFEKQQSLASAELQRQKVIKNSTIVIGGLVLLIGLLAYIFHRRRQKVIDSKKDAEFKTTVAETELKALRSQMNPHFIFNSLNSISDFMAKNDLEKADDYLVKFSQLMRAILENSDQKWISLAEEMRCIELYMGIECQRLDPKLSFDLQVDPSLDTNNVLVPPLISQPFLENSIWHGIAPKASGGHVNLQFKRQEDFLVCTIDDNGVGRNVKTNGHADKSSMGVRITKNRLDIINQMKKVRGSVKMVDKEEGLQVVLTLPLEFQF